MNAPISSPEKKSRHWFLLLLGAVAMAYGWGFRGVVGHEAGAMAAGSLMGLAVALGSPRLDWHRRAAVAALFGAAGWAWGGSLSYMEQTFYVTSRSFPDVLYGYSVLFLEGALWAGIGGALLGLAFTEKRLTLRALTGPFTAVGLAYLLIFLYFLAYPERREAYEIYTVIHFHDGEWLAALVALLVSAIYGAINFRRQEHRNAAALVAGCAIAWWLGYGLLTKWGGLRLAPPFRSESWGGVLGILAAILVYLARRKNYAALLLARYGLLGGGLAFPLAVFIRHPLIVQWGPFRNLPGLPQWKIAEMSFGFFMGLAIALGARRLLQNNLRAPDEDIDPRFLDTYSVFVVLVALSWMNLRRIPMYWLKRFALQSAHPFLHIPAPAWYLAWGILLTLPVLYALYRYVQGHRPALLPQSAYGKGTLLLVVLLVTTFTGVFVRQPCPPDHPEMLTHTLFLFCICILFLMLISRNKETFYLPENQVPPDSPDWLPGKGTWTLAVLTPVFLVALTVTSMAMQDKALSVSRKRFGPEAYWRQVTSLVGDWKTVGRAESLESREEPRPASVSVAIRFLPNRHLEATIDGHAVSCPACRWFNKNQFLWLRWAPQKAGETAQPVEIPLRFRDRRLYIPWPPAHPGPGYLVLEKSGSPRD